MLVLPGTGLAPGTQGGTGPDAAPAAAERAPLEDERARCARHYEAVLGALRRAADPHLRSGRALAPARERVARRMAAEACLPRFLDLAERGSHRAAAWCLAHLFDLEAGDPLRDRAPQLFGRLVRECCDEPWLVGGEDDVLLSLERAARELPEEEVLAIAMGLFERSRRTSARAAALSSAARVLSRSGASGDAAERRGRALELLERAVEFDPDAPEAARARDAIWRLTHLAPGSIAPDFETRDVDANEIRLSDYRGKVVVLCFWGFWSPASQELLAELSALETERRTAPFAVLGINSDRDPEELRRRIEELDLPWTSSFEGSPEGAVPTAWRVREWPSVYVLDHRGVIHAVGPRGRALEAAVTDLLIELVKDQGHRAADEARIPLPPGSGH